MIFRFHINASTYCGYFLMRQKKFYAILQPIDGRLAV